MRRHSTFLGLALCAASTFFLVLGCGGSDSKKGAADTSDSDAASNGNNPPDGGNNVPTGALGFCDVDNSGTHTCIDYLPGYTGSVANGCAVLQGAYSATGSCSHTNNVGGCKQNVGKQTIWYYSPLTMDDVRVTCADNPDSMFVAP